MKMDEKNAEQACLKSMASSLPMEELLKFKTKIGHKAYSQLIFDESNDNEAKTVKRKVKTEFKIENKNCPQELSSKKAPSTFTNQPKQLTQIARDPRFEENCGKFNKKVFQQTYKFLNNLEVNEKGELLKVFKKTKNEKRKKQIQNLIQRLDNQERAEKSKLANQERIKKMQLEKRQLYNKKNKVYISKSEIKKAELLDKFKQLQKSSKLEKYLEKKRKKLASKDRKNMVKRVNR